ncbi:hypothetical protein GCM10019059_34670 [Camelimonas fluminis]|uniref:GcrA cell cycle regulator n=1 Tax=Camelimonas fluminis TaxID=1576911 RepID=A0ABV7UFV7_9HYPH|nr:hypothetical protein [Camelimonas fluminis]GHE72141.1 hypothetical protein GCM10019059_34670 [Camelimonas fluminis]
MSIPLMSARRDQCRWFEATPAPVQHRRGKLRADAFSSHYVCGATVRPGSSYCPEHCLRVYAQKPTGDQQS